MSLTGVAWRWGLSQQLGAEVTTTQFTHIAGIPYWLLTGALAGMVSSGTYMWLLHEHDVLTCMEAVFQEWMLQETKWRCVAFLGLSLRSHLVSLLPSPIDEVLKKFYQRPREGDVNPTKEWEEGSMSHGKNSMYCGVYRVLCTLLQ
jgi:hypothetical protein